MSCPTMTRLPFPRSNDVTRCPGSRNCRIRVRAGGNARRHRAEGSLERLLPDRKRLVELRVADDERAEDADAVRVDAGLEQEQAAFRRGLDDGGRELAVRLLGRSVAYELEREHRAEAAYVADGREALLPGEQACPQDLSDERRALDQAFLLEDVEHRERSCLRDRV